MSRVRGMEQGPPPGRREEGERGTSARQLLRQQRELEEKRKFGLAPLAVDTVTHQEISPNVPHTIAQAPWYYGATGPTLAHQRKAPQVADGVLVDSVDAVVVVGKAKRFEAGSCKNCGSRTHKASECFQAKKRVGAVYTDKVTGADVQLHRSEKSYAQKRDRYVGDVGVDLLRHSGHEEDTTEGTTTRAGNSDGSGKGETGGTAGGAPAPVAQRRRVEDVFAARTAQHGGVEIKELPKYLESLEDHSGLFFDPRTGSMRGNPNVHDPTKAFQGDLERYRSGDYYNYIETQYRFLTGQSSSFVDFAFDEEMGKQKEKEAEALSSTAVGKGEAGEGGQGQVGDSVHDTLVRSLYGATTASTSTATSTQPMPPPPARSSSATAVSSSHAPSTELAAVSSTGDREQMEVGGQSDTTAAQLMRELLEQAVSGGTAAGHRSVYGSYFDTKAFAWGYQCCKRVGRHAPGCLSK